MIAHDLWYVSMIRLIDIEDFTIRWEVTASFTRTHAMTVTGSTPDATLNALAVRAISSPTFMPPAPKMILEPIAADMLRLLLMRSRQYVEFPPLWTATAWTRFQPAVSAVGRMPDEALRNLVVMVNPSFRH
jgi:hypothetical protein